MKNVQIGIRFMTAVMLVAVGVSVSRDAIATPTCVNNLGSFSPSSSGTSPSVTNCYFADYVSVGPNVGMLAQDQSVSSAAGTYAFEANSLNNTAIYATAGSSGGYAGEFVAPGTGTAGTNATLYGDATGTGGTGVLGTGYGYGVYGFSSSGNAVYGLSGSGWGVVGTLTGNAPGTTAGVYGDGNTNDGVFGTSSSGNGVVGKSTSSTGNSGVAGLNTSSGNGVYGSSTSGYGVYGVTGGGNNYGVYGTSSSNSSGDGVVGEVSNGWAGVAGLNNGSGPAVFGQANGTGYAGSFVGSVNVSFAESYYYDGSTCVGGLCSSDQRLKKNIAPLTGAMDQLLQLKGVTFEWKNPEERGHGAGTRTGFIAQEVEKVFPGWVEEDSKGMKGIVLPPMQVAALEVEALRELKDRADKAEARAAKAEARSNALEARLAALEANRRPLISGLTAEGGLFGIGFVTMEGRKPKADPMAKRTPGIPGPSACHEPFGT